jgi:hypothetical protein
LDPVKNPFVGVSHGFGGAQDTIVNKIEIKIVFFIIFIG